MNNQKGKICLEICSMPNR